MLHFLTDAPLFELRAIMSFARGWVEATGQHVDDAPAWATAHLHVSDEDAVNVLTALKGWRVESRRPARVAIADPVFAMAAARIDRPESGSAPAASWAR